MWEEVSREVDSYMIFIIMVENLGESKCSNIEQWRSNFIAVMYVYMEKLQFIATPKNTGL